MSDYIYDANSVAYVSKQPWRRGEQTPFHNPVEVFEWGLHNASGQSIRDVHRACWTCSVRWDGKNPKDDSNMPKWRTPDTAERPPGTIRRASCAGCYASHFDKVEPEDSTPEERQELLDQYLAALNAEDKHTREHSRRVREAYRWAVFLEDWTWICQTADDDVRETWERTRATFEATFAPKERTFTEREQKLFNQRRIRLETNVNLCRQACLDAGFDPVRVLASGGLTTP